MKGNNKKALYESIMTSVAKEVKKVLNEDNKYSVEGWWDNSEQTVIKYLSEYCNHVKQNIEILHKEGPKDEHLNRTMWELLNYSILVMVISAKFYNKLIDKDKILQNAKNNDTIKNDFENFFAEITNLLKKWWKFSQKPGDSDDFLKRIFNE